MKWLIDGAVKDRQTVTASWSPADQRLIDGVTVREIANVPKQNGYLTEIFRNDWAVDALQIDQVFQIVLNAGAVSAWHAHANTSDRLFVSFGLMRIVFYDARDDSPTGDQVNEFRFGTVRRGPPRVWHGVQNISAESSVVLNLVDRAYDYPHRLRDDSDRYHRYRRDKRRPSRRTSREETRR
jgi:dTDP-4-dehydrorhamnose 3,5-epimerase